MLHDHTLIYHKSPRILAVLPPRTRITRIYLSAGITDWTSADALLLHRGTSSLLVTWTSSSYASWLRKLKKPRCVKPSLPERTYISRLLLSSLMGPKIGSKQRFSTIPSSTWLDRSRLETRLGRRKQ